MTSDSTRVVWVAAALLSVPVLAGCAGLPDSSHVQILVEDLPPGGRTVAHEGRVEFRAGSYTALDQLMDLAERRGFVVNTTYHESFDATLVDAIDGLANQAGPNATYYFWQFELDGAPSGTGADKVLLQDDQSVTWRYVLG